MRHLTVRSYRKEVSPVLQRHFGLRKDEAGYCLRGILSVGKQKKAQITSYFPPAVGARLKREDFTDVLIFRSLQRHLGLRLDVAHVTVRAEVADKAMAADLGIALGSAILTVEMLYQSADQQNVEFTIARHPADLFSITYDAPNDLAVTSNWLDHVRPCLRSIGQFMKLLHFDKQSLEREGT